MRRLPLVLTAVAVYTLIAMPASGQARLKASAPERALVGLKTMAVVIEKFDETTLGFTADDLRRLVAKNLEGTGIELISQSELLKQGTTPIYDISISAITPNRPGATVYTVYSTLNECCRLSRDMSVLVVNAVTWEHLTTGVADARDLRNRVYAVIDQDSRDFAFDAKKARVVPAE